MEFLTIYTEEPKKLGATDFFMLLVVTFWAVNFTIIKVALRELSPLAFNGIRLLVASLFLIIILVIRKERLSIEKSDIWKIFVLSLIGNTIFQLCFIRGLHLSTASNTSVVMAMSPVFVALLSSSLKQEKIHWAAWLGILFSLVGFCLVISKQGGFMRFSWQHSRGDLIVLFGNLLWAVYTVFSRPLIQKMSAIKFTSLTLAIGSLCFLPFSGHDIIQLRFGDVSIQAWAALSFSGVFALSISYIIWYSSIKRVGTTKTAIYNNFVPVMAIVFAWIFLAERFTLRQTIGTAMILIGVFFTRSGYRLVMASSGPYQHTQEKEIPGLRPGCRSDD